MSNQPDARDVLMEGFAELVADLKQIATQDIELKSPPVDAGDLPVLVLQHRVAYQLAVVDRFLARHVAEADRLPLRAVSEAVADLTKTKASPLLQPVPTTARPKASNAADPEHWQILCGLVCAAMRAYMDDGKNRPAAAVLVARALERHGIGDPQGQPLGDKTIRRWDERPDLKRIRDRFIAGLKANRPDDWTKPDTLVDDLLIRWREEAEARAYRFKAKRKTVVRSKLKSPD